ncbi:hypothetical protein V8G54_021595 [Vigna mungo]|uniref:Uncharacterized protein n=1 Tax=Vigna mungo TaxID=3915 RepID=A0AAQ3NDQ9_VIGMU
MASSRSLSSSGVRDSGLCLVWYKGLDSEKMGKQSCFHGKLKEGSLCCHLSKSLILSRRLIGHIAVIFTITKLTCHIKQIHCVTITIIIIPPPSKTHHSPREKKGKSTSSHRIFLVYYGTKRKLKGNHDGSRQ